MTMVYDRQPGTEHWVRPNDIRAGKVSSFPVMLGMNPWNMTDGEIADHLIRFGVPLYDDPDHPGSWRAVVETINTAYFYGFDGNDGIYLTLYPNGEGGMPDAALESLIAERKKMGRVVSQQFLDNVAAARTKFGRDPVDPYGERRVMWENNVLFPGNDRLMTQEDKKYLNTFR